MKNNRYLNAICTTTTVLAVILCSVTGAAATELFPNGDFSSGTISPWDVSTGSPSVDNVNSPFTNVYANDGYSMVENKPAGSAGISAYASFTPATSGVVKFNYDFKLTNLSVNWQMFGLLTSKGFIFNNVWDGPYDHFILWDGDPDLHVCGLKADTWYNVQEEINLDTWTYSGKITEYNGGTASWDNRNLQGSYAPIQQIGINEANPNSGANTIHYDNISVSTVPEPGTCVTLLSGLLGTCGFVLRKRK